MSIVKIDRAIRDCLSARQILVGDTPLHKQNRSVVQDALVAFTCYTLDLNSKSGIERSHTEQISAVKRMIRAYTDEEGNFSLSDLCVDLEAIRAQVTKPESTLLELDSLKFNFQLLLSADFNHRAEWNGLANFLLKVNLDRPDLQDEMFEKYKHAEMRASMHNDWNPAVVKELRTIITQWFSKLDLSDLRPKHGCGAVSDPKVHTLYEKYAALKTPIVPVPRSELLTYYPYYTSIASNMRTGGDITKVSDYTSRLIFVPKSWKALRTVKPEPVELQYWQQAIMEKIYDYCCNHRYLSKHFPFRDQSRHHRLIRVGSWSKCYSTIDLSQASDSVSVALVRALFQDTALYPWLMSTRSSSYKYKNVTYSSNIFAGMGSALCFPVETIVFGAICEYCLRLFKKATPSSLAGYTPDPAWSVYGDDIIVVAPLYKAVVLVLNHLGFIVNDDKSFHHSFFLESCGKEYYDGIDVTPLRYKVDHLHGLSTTIQGLVALGNRALVLHDAHTLYRWCRMKCNNLIDKRNQRVRTEKRKHKKRPLWPYIGEHLSYPSDEVLDNTLFYPEDPSIIEDLLSLAESSQDREADWVQSILYQSGKYRQHKLRYNQNYQAWEVQSLVVRTRVRYKWTPDDGYGECILLHEALRRKMTVNVTGIPVEATEVDPYARLSGTVAELKSAWLTIG